MLSSLCINIIKIRLTLDKFRVDNLNQALTSFSLVSMTNLNRLSCKHLRKCILQAFIKSSDCMVNTWKKQVQMLLEWVIIKRAYLPWISKFCTKVMTRRNSDNLNLVYPNSFKHGNMCFFKIQITVQGGIVKFGPAVVFPLGWSFVIF